MRDSFKPWRRKAGVVTLGMACVFAAVWVRSDWKTDQLFYQANAKSLHVIYSCRQGIGWTRIKDFHKVPVPVGTVALESINANVDNVTLPPPNRLNTERCPQWLCVRFGIYWVGSLPSLEEIRFFVAHHCLIVTPLTLLSAWLLLSKPKPKAELAQSDA